MRISCTSCTFCTLKRSPGVGENLFCSAFLKKKQIYPPHFWAFNVHDVQEVQDRKKSEAKNARKRRILADFGPKSMYVCMFLYIYKRKMIDFASAIGESFAFSWPGKSRRTAMYSNVQERTARRCLGRLRRRKKDGGDGGSAPPSAMRPTDRAMWSGYVWQTVRYEVHVGG